MGEIIFITGGARSGKSYHAERLAGKYQDVAYIATAVITDDEMKLRVQRHQEQRPQEWTTYEEPYDIARVIRSHSHETYLIDCVTVYITNLLLKEKENWDSDIVERSEQMQLENAVEKKIRELVLAMKECGGNFIVVSNEVGLGLVPAYPLGRVFRDAVGRANQMIAAEAAQVYLSVSGVLLPLKGKEEEI